MPKPTKQALDAQQLAEQSSAALHASDRCAQTLAIEIVSVEPGKATLTMVVSESYANGHGICQGGIITTLADTAFAHACNSYNRKAVAQSLSIEFMGPAHVGEKLTAIASEKSRGKRTGVYVVEVFNTQRKLLALMTGRSFSSHASVIND